MVHHTDNKSLWLKLMKFLHFYIKNKIILLQVILITNISIETNNIKKLMSQLININIYISPFTEKNYITINNNCDYIIYFINNFGKAMA